MLDRTVLFECEVLEVHDEQVDLKPRSIVMALHESLPKDRKYSTHIRQYNEDGTFSYVAGKYELDYLGASESFHNRTAWLHGLEAPFTKEAEEIMKDES